MTSAEAGTAHGDAVRPALKAASADSGQIADRLSAARSAARMESRMPYRLARSSSVVLLFGLACADSASAAICYVKPGAAPANSGTSWATATALQTALKTTACTEVWAAGGIYLPSPIADPAASFRLLPGAALYGGFAGTESDRTQRDPRANRTILSGDIDGNDTGSNGIDATPADIKGVNSYHVVFLDGTDSGNPITGATILDGLVITGGNAVNGANDPYGGGLFCDASMKPEAECNPMLTNVLFSGNHAQIYGGAMIDWAIYGGSASPTLIDVTFRGNTVGTDPPTGTAQGGAMYNEGYGGNSSPVLINVTFADNGGTNPVATAVHGGAMYNSGYYGISTPVLVNVTFSGNLAYQGGAIANNGIGGICKPVLINALLWGNTNLLAAGVTLAQMEISEENGAVTTIRNSIVQDGCPGGDTCDLTVSHVDPALGPLQDNGGVVPTFALPVGSSAIDTGLDGDCPAVDARGITRPQGTHCDIGAYEFVDAIFASGFDGP